MDFKRYIQELEKTKVDYDSDRFYSDIDYRRAVEPLLKERTHNQHLLKVKYKKAHDDVIPLGDEKLMIEYLKLRRDSFSVVELLMVFPSFSKNLLKGMMKAGIDETNPSVNRFYIEPCIRVYDVFTVNDIILEYVTKGTKDEQIGALRCIYWTRSNACLVNGKPHRIVYEWADGFGFKKRNEITEDLTDYLGKVSEMKKKRIGLLLDVASNENDADTLNHIFKELPNKVDDFDSEYQSLAEKLFSLKYRGLVLKIYTPYRRLAGVGDRAERKKIWEEQTVLVNKLRAEVEQKIKEGNNI